MYLNLAVISERNVSAFAIILMAFLGVVGLAGSMFMILNTIKKYASIHKQKRSKVNSGSIIKYTKYILKANPPFSNTSMPHCHMLNEGRYDFNRRLMTESDLFQICESGTCKPMFTAISKSQFTFSYNNAVQSESNLFCEADLRQTGFLNSADESDFVFSVEAIYGF